MDKDAYFKRGTREKLVQTFLGKLDVTQIKDADIVVALNRYIETGDETFFTEFTKWSEAKDKEQQLQEKKERLQSYEEALKKWEQDLSEYKKHLESEYNELKIKLDKYRREIAEFYKNDYFPHGETVRPTVSDLFRCLKEKGEKSQAQIWVVTENGKTFTAARNVTIDNGHVAISLDYSNKIELPDPPHKLINKGYYVEF